MAGKHQHPGQRKQASGGSPRSGDAPSATRDPSGAWRLVHPLCARQRTDDIEEVDAMLAAGEPDVARDELRFLLEDCPEFLAAHQKLGEIALEAGDLKLARGHFGYVYDRACKALAANSPAVPLPYELPDNQVAHESGKGLAWCLHELGEPATALGVLRQMLAWDASDPLGVRVWLEQWGA